MASLCGLIFAEGSRGPNLGLRTSEYFFGGF
jgi:hypothetical protein